MTFSFGSMAVAQSPSVWRIKKCKGYNIRFESADKVDVKTYQKLIDHGISSVRSFFNEPYKNHFEVYLHPDRKSLDTQWQKDWNLPDFKSECWMVASGVGTRLDLISPKNWEHEACEHTYKDKLSTQNLLTHELVHVYHGQNNSGHDFSDVTGLDWFVEGLATYVSGQCDSSRVAEVKKALMEHKIPKTPDQYWTGNLKYGLSGTMVMYIDKIYGREKIIKLLQIDRLTDLLHELNTSEEALISGWNHFCSGINNN